MEYDVFIRDSAHEGPERIRGSNDARIVRRDGNPFVLMRCVYD